MMTALHSEQDKESCHHIEDCNYRCDYIFYCGYQIVPCWCHGNVHFSSLSEAVQNKQNMYCKNVRNYTIKMQVFDYLTNGSKFCMCGTSSAIKVFYMMKAL